MLETEVDELRRNGENSGVEFKRDDVHVDNLAKEICALANFEGGRILLGVEDDGSVSGLSRSIHDTEEWVMNICRENMRPPIIPYWETLTSAGQAVGVITLPADSPDKPYKARRGAAWTIFIRVGSTSREATREEEVRLYQASGLMRYDIKPAIGSGVADLDARRLENYFRDVLHQEVPPAADEEAWRRQLLNTDILVEDRGVAICTVGGLLLFGVNPNRHMPQAGLTATAYPGPTKDYATVDEDVIRGPLVSFVSRSGKRILEPGVIERAVDFVARNMGTAAHLVKGRRRRRGAYPPEAVREATVNAFAHRDYSIAITDVELSLYSDRMEVISPGRLPNTVTVDKMRQGYRAARNELLKEILRDYGYVEHRGMGVRNRIIEGMRAHNGTEPDLVEEESRFIVRLLKG